MNNQLTNKTRHDFDLKKEYVEYICQCVKENKRNKTILSELEERYGCECYSKYTIIHWIAALKSKNEEYVRDKLGSKCMKYWEELKRLKYSTNSRKTHEISLKGAYIQFIFECLKQNKQNGEILESLQERLGSRCIPKGTITKWICAFKSLERHKAKAYLGSEWLGHWDAMHAESSHESTEAASNHSAGADSTLKLASSSMGIDSCQNIYLHLDIIEVSENSDTGCLRSPVRPSEGHLTKTVCFEPIATQAGSTIAVKENHDLPDVIKIRQDSGDGFLKLPIKSASIKSNEPDRIKRSDLIHDKM